jgi:hypothetical protein
VRSANHAAKIGNLGNFGNFLATRTYERSYFEFPEFASLARGCSEKVSDVSEVSGSGVSLEDESFVEATA